MMDNAGRVLAFVDADDMGPLVLRVKEQGLMISFTPDRQEFAQFFRECLRRLEGPANEVEAECIGCNNPAGWISNGVCRGCSENGVRPVKPVAVTHDIDPGFSRQVSTSGDIMPRVETTGHVPAMPAHPDHRAFLAEERITVLESKVATLMAERGEE